MSGGREREATSKEQEQDQERVWHAAWSAARPLVDGVTRGRAPGAEPGVELAWLDWGGPGPLVVLVHANGFCAATWAPIAAALRARHRVVAIDVRGHGDSTSVPPEHGPQAYAWTTLARDVDHAVAAILAQTGHARVALGVGHSMGGALLASDALAHPGRYARLLLCDPVLLPPVRRAPGAEGGPAENPLATATRRRRDRFPSAAAAYAHCRSRALYAGFTPEALALYVGLGMREREDGTLELKCPREVEAAIFDNGASLDLMARMDSLSAELLILHAARSGFSKPYYEALAERAPRASVESVDAGHLFPMDEPRLVLEAIDRLDRHEENQTMSMPSHPDVIRPERYATFNPEKMGKDTLFESERILVGLNTFLPGQSHALHAHEGIDKVYHVLEGRGRFLLASRELAMQPGDMLIAPSGVPHGIRNDGDEKLVVLAILAPGPKKG